MTPTRLTALLLILLPTLSLAANPKPIRVLIWDEQQPAQKQAYGDTFLGGTIAAHLSKNPTLQVKTAALKDPNQGITPDILDHTDVLI